MTAASLCTYDRTQGCALYECMTTGVTVLYKDLLPQGCAVFLGVHARSSAVVLVQPLLGAGAHAEEEAREKGGDEEQDDGGYGVGHL